MNALYPISQVKKMYPADAIKYAVARIAAIDECVSEWNGKADDQYYEDRLDEREQLVEVLAGYRTSKPVYFAEGKVVRFTEATKYGAANVFLGRQFRHAGSSRWHVGGTYVHAARFAEGEFERFGIGAELNALVRAWIKITND